VTYISMPRCNARVFFLIYSSFIIQYIFLQNFYRTFRIFLCICIFKFKFWNPRSKTGSTSTRMPKALLALSLSRPTFGHVHPQTRNIRWRVTASVVYPRVVNPAKCCWELRLGCHDCRRSYLFANVFLFICECYCFIRICCYL
jgi:hypothetical protein